MSADAVGTPQDPGFQWQVGVWNKIADVYLREIDARFAPVVERVTHRARLMPSESVLDLGAGTGSVAVRAASLVGEGGAVLAVEPSGEMIALGQGRVASLGLSNVTFREGRAEAIPAENASVDVVLASLCLMYVIDRRAATREIARVLRPGGRLVAAVWAGPEECDIVRFQQTAGRFAPAPPIAGVGPGALADPSTFLSQLGKAGIEATVERELLGFDFPSFDLAWDVLAGVTAAGLDPERREEAKAAVRAAMWPEPAKPRVFRNTTQFIIGRRSGRPDGVP